jgi:hypothetical protein
MRKVRLPPGGFQMANSCFLQVPISDLDLDLGTWGLVHYALRGWLHFIMAVAAVMKSRPAYSAGATGWTWPLLLNSHCGVCQWRARRGRQWPGGCRPAVSQVLDNEQGGKVRALPNSGSNSVVA